MDADYDYYAFDLTPFFDPLLHPRIERGPLIQGAIVMHNGKRFRVDRWFRRIKGVDHHCYVFINISNNGIKPFGKKPTDIRELITSGKLVIEKII